MIDSMCFMCWSIQSICDPDGWVGTTGSFCPPGVMEPMKCSGIFQVCHAGAKKVDVNVTSAGSAFGVLAFLLVVNVVWLHIWHHRTHQQLPEPGPSKSEGCLCTA